MGKSNTHVKYHTKDGILVPGVTTVLGVLAKPALVPWANKLGLQGIEVGKYVDNLAGAGTLGHAFCEADFTRKEVDVSDYTPNQVAMAKNVFKKFLAWKGKQTDFSVIDAEIQLVSETHMFGGTCDLYCQLSGKQTLIDIKTAKAVYGDHFTQVAAYKILLEEHGYKVEDVKILRIGREDAEGFDEKDVPMIGVHQEKFLACLKVLQLNNKLKERT